MTECDCAWCRSNRIYNKEIMQMLKERQKEVNMNEDKLKYKYAEDNSNSDREFLEWIWQRLVTCYNERPSSIYMQRLDKIIANTPGQSSADKPVFEIRYPSGKFTYKIWADGRTEGFSDSVIVVNRIPQLIAEAKQK